MRENKSIDSKNKKRELLDRLVMKTIRGGGGSNCQGMVIPCVEGQPDCSAR